MTLARRWIPLLAALLVVAGEARAQCPDWAPGFSSPWPGTDGTVRSLAVFDDGSGPALYAGGWFSTAGGVSAANIARWNGTSWSALGAPGSGTNAWIESLAVFDDGSGPALYAGGEFTIAGGTASAHVARWDGTNWSALGAPGDGVSDRVHALAVFDDGSGSALYVGGTFTTAGAVSAHRIARWDGTVWSALGAPGSGTNGPVFSLAVFDDGTGPALYAGGSFTTAGHVSASRIARWDGTSWSALGAGTDSWITCLAVFDDGSGPALHVGGQFSSAGGIAASRIAKWDGTSWSALGPPGGGLDSAPTSLAGFDDGSGPRLYAAGSFTSAGGAFALHIASWDGTSWSALGATGGGTNHDVHGLAVFDDGSGPALYAGGAFTTAGGGAVSRIARWDGVVWSVVGAPGNGTNAHVQCLAVFDDGTAPALYAAGSFTTAGGVSAAGIARWDGTSWSTLGAPGSSPNGGIYALAAFDDGSGPALYAAGDFTSIGGVAAARIARWDGTSWSALPGGGTDQWITSLAVFDDGSGPALHAGGNFTSAGGVAAFRVARWDGTSWSALGTGMNGTVESFAVFDDGPGPALYAAGSFTTAGGVSAPRIARWNGTSWSALGAPGSGMNNWVWSLAVFDDGAGPALYAGGTFTTAGGVSAARIARWDGTSWSALGGPADGTDQRVSCLAVFDDGLGPALYAGGQFTTAGGRPASHVAGWDGSTWSALGAAGGGTNGAVNGLAVFDDGTGPRLYAGGAFTSAGPHASHSIAAWRGCVGAAVPYCFGDGSSAPCPCGNSGLPGHGCDNSIASGGALLSASGTIAPDALVLTQSGELASSTSVFLQGSSSLASPAPFGDGLRCAGGALLRLYVRPASAGTVSAPGPGDPSISARSAALGDPLSPGDVRHYQVHYRDPDPAFCAGPAGSTFNVGNALRVAW